MNSLLCDSGPLIATYNVRDRYFPTCTRLLAEWSGRLVIPEPVLGETCSFLRNQVRNGPALEVQFLDGLVAPAATSTSSTPPKTIARATELAKQFVAAPLGYVDATIIAMAERMKMENIATTDFKFLGMASQVSRLKPLRWALQER